MNLPQGARKLKRGQLWRTGYALSGFYPLASLALSSLFARCGGGQTTKAAVHEGRTVSLAAQPNGDEMLNRFKATRGRPMFSQFSSSVGDASGNFAATSAPKKGSGCS